MGNAHHDGQKTSSGDDLDSPERPTSASSSSGTSTQPAIKTDCASTSSVSGAPLSPSSDSTLPSPTVSLDVPRDEYFPRNFRLRQCVAAQSVLSALVYGVDNCGQKEVFVLGCGHRRIANTRPSVAKIVSRRDRLSGRFVRWKFAVRPPRDARDPAFFVPILRQRLSSDRVQAVFFVYDVTRPVTLEYLKKRLVRFLKEMTLSVRSRSGGTEKLSLRNPEKWPVALFVVATRIEKLEEAQLNPSVIPVSMDSVDSWCAPRGVVKQFRVSFVNGKGIKPMFIWLSRYVLDLELFDLTKPMPVWATKRTVEGEEEEGEEEAGMLLTPVERWEQACSALAEELEFGEDASSSVYVQMGTFMKVRFASPDGEKRLLLLPRCLGISCVLDLQKEDSLSGDDEGFDSDEALEALMREIDDEF